MNKHSLHDGFERYYNRLPQNVQKRAIRKIGLLFDNPKHPSLYLKKVKKTLWAARVSDAYRMLAFERKGTLVWFWIGKHDEYERRIRQG